MVPSIVWLTAFCLVDKSLSIFFLLQNFLADVCAFVPAKLQEVILQNPANDIHGGDGRCDLFELVPQGGIRILHRIVVLYLRGNGAPPRAKRDTGDIV